MMRKVLPVESYLNNGVIIGYMVVSPATKQVALFCLEDYGFNGDLVNPTFYPSMTIDADGMHRHEHFNVIYGNIEYLPDCDHKFAGRTISMVDVSVGGL